MADQNEQGAEDQKNTAETKPDQQKPDNQNQQEASPSKPADDSENNEAKKNAEHVLNRLKDQPGKAMIPAYRKTEVEKDW
jgi:Ca-activated chloride channel family protein